MKKLLIAVLALMVSSTQAYISENEARALIFFDTEKYAQFMKKQEIELNFKEFIFFAAVMDREIGKKIKNNEILTYKEVERFITYDQYLKFLPEYESITTDMKRWKKYTTTTAKIQMLALLGGTAHYMFNVKNEPKTLKNALYAALYAGGIHLGLNIVEGIFWLKYAYMPRMKGCTVKIKNLSDEEITYNRTKSEQIV